MRIAAIDIGSNSVKLIVVEASASDSFAVLSREKEMVRLGHETLAKGTLSVAAIERAADTIGRFNSIAVARGAEKVIAVATAAVREARNADEFIAEQFKRTGVRIEILSAIEEARLIGVAVAQGCGGQGMTLLNVDIGGGSTELSAMQDGEPVQLISVKLGAVGLTERFLLTDPPRQKEMRALRTQIRSALERPGRELRGVRWLKTTGTSGTILALGAALKLRSNGVNIEEGAQPAGDDIVLSQLESFNAKVAQLDHKQRAALPAISAQRGEIVIAGGQILEGVMRALGVNVLRTCEYALREGVIIDRLRQIEAESKPPVPDVSDPKLRSVQAVGKRFGYEEVHAHQVARLAEKIFDAIADRHGLTRNQRALVSAAALLHDAGYHIAHDSHHKHSLYLVKHSELTGFSEDERKVIANAVRYHRGSAPKERHIEFAALSHADRLMVWQVGAIVRLADALDRSYESKVADLRISQGDKSISIELLSEFDCERELEAVQQKGEMFQTAFNCRLEVTRVPLSSKRG